MALRQQPVSGGEHLPPLASSSLSLPSTPSSGPVSPNLPAALLQPPSLLPTPPTSPGREESPLLPVAPVIFPQPLPCAPYTASPYSIELPPSSSNDLRRTLIRTFHESGVDAQFISPFKAQCFKRACATSSEFFAQAWHRGGGHHPHKTPGFLLELSRVQGDVGNFVRAVECIRGVVLKKWGGRGGGAGGEEEPLHHTGASSSGGGGEKAQSPPPLSSSPAIPAASATPAAVTAGKVRRLREEALLNLADALFDSDPGQAEEAAHAVTRMAMNAQCLEELGERAQAAHLELMVGEVGEEGGKGGSASSSSTVSPTKPPVGILQILSALLKRVCGDSPGSPRQQSGEEGVAAATGASTSASSSSSSSGGGGGGSLPPPSLSPLSSSLSPTVVDSRSASAFALSTLAVNPHCASALGALLGGVRLLRTISHLPAGEAALAALRREAARTVMRVFAAQGGVGGARGQEGPEWEEWEALLMALMDDPEGEVRDCAFALISAASSPLESQDCANTVATSS